MKGSGKGALGRHFARFKCEHCLKRFRSKKALGSHSFDKSHRVFRSLEESKYVTKT